MKKTIFIALLSTFVFTGCKLCKTSKEEQPKEIAQMSQPKGMIKLENTEWELVSIGDRKFEKLDWMSSDNIRLKFMEGGVVGTSDGCNGLGGEYVQEANIIKFSNWRSTRMYCGDEAAKQLYILPTEDIYKFAFRNGVLEFYSVDGKVIASYISVVE